MTAAPARILCLGRNAELLKSRCAILAYTGYKADAAIIPEGFEQLSAEKYDLVIISARLAEENGDLLPTDLPTLVLDGIVLPIELMHQVAEKLEPRAHPSL
jgi:hypothetical protein